MSRATYFDQDCPTCGRPLQVRVEHLGKCVVCRHCHAEFRSADTSIRAPDEIDELMVRAERLLPTVDELRRTPK